MPLIPGDRVDRYIIEDLIGAGGQATVWAVRHHLLGTRHALKVLQTPSTAAQQRLLQEGRAQAQLRHPNLLPVRDIFDLDGGRYGLLMPLVSGPALARLLDDGPLPEPQALAVLHAILDGLEAAHTAGFIHRDLKPDNVLLECLPERILPRISDFGLVKAPGSDTRTGAVLGTPRYCAPEILSDASRADARSDLFSLGVLLVELVAGHCPYTGPGFAEIVLAQQRPPDLTGMTGTLRDVAAALLAMEPAARPTDCAALRQLLPVADPGVLGEPALLDRVMRCHRIPASFTSDSQSSLPSFSQASHTIELPVAHNLPVARDPFVGREATRAQLEALLTASRLITLIGPGGAGKTRLSLEFGRQTLSKWPGGVWLIGLSEAHSEAALLAAVGRGLSVQLGPDPVGQLGRVIADRGPALFIFDNFEQLTAHAGLLGAWLDGAAEATVLVTSRQPLRLKGERVVVLPPMTHDDAVDLFLLRSRGGRDGDAAAVGALVELLDRLPLAIELAAARARMFSPAQLTSRLSRRFALLKSRSPELPDRHRTLRAALLWSFQLLQPAERAVLLQCSLFEGGIPLDIAEEIIDVTGEEWVDEVLSELVDKSMLQRGEDAADGTPRLTMLISVQELCAEMRGEGLDGMRHAAAFARFGTRDAMSALQQCRSARQKRLLDERANLRVAAERALTAGAWDVAAQCARAWAHTAELNGPMLAGAALLERVRQALPAAHPMHGPLLRQEGWIRHSAGRLEQGRALMEESVTVYRQLGDPLGEAHALIGAGFASQSAGQRDLAAERYDAALALGQAHGDAFTEAMALEYQGLLSRVMGRLPDSEARLLQALSIFERLNNGYHEVIITHHLSIVSRRMGRLTIARQRGERARRLSEALGDRRLQMNIHNNLGIIAFRQERYDAARRRLAVALEHSRQLGARGAEGRFYNNLGLVEKAQGRLAAARAAFEHSVTISRKLGTADSEARILMNMGQAVMLSEDLEEALRLMRSANDIYRRIQARGGLLSGFINEGALLIELGHHDQARKVLDEAVRLGTTLASFQLVQVARSSRGLASAHLGEVDAGRAQIQQSIDAVCADGNVMYLPTLQAQLAQVELLAGRHDEVHRLLGVLRSHNSQNSEVLRSIAQIERGVGLNPV